MRQPYLCNCQKKEMGGCSATNCTNSSSKGYRLFVFPRDPNRRRQWLANCRKAADWIPTRNSRLCAMHFEENQFEKGRMDGLLKLKPNAIPTIFPNRNAWPVPTVPSYVSENRSGGFEKIFLYENAVANEELNEIKIKEEPELSIKEEIENENEFQVKTEIVEPDVTKYNCVQCSWTTDSKDDLRQHIVQHNLETQYLECRYCSFKSSSVSEFRRHVYQHQDGSCRDCKCVQCPFQKRQKICLVNRSKPKATALKRYRCVYCSNRFKNMNCLVVHISKRHKEVAILQEEKRLIFIKM